MNEGTGTAVNDSAIPTAENGTAVDSPSWVIGFPDNIAPGAPTGLIATGVLGAVNLAWTAPADTDIAGYNIYRGTTIGGEGSIPINSSLVTGVTYSDNTGVTGTPYYYVVKTVDTSGNSSPASSEVTGTPLAGTPPNAPSGLTATATSAIVVTLNWTDNSNNETGFEIHRSTTGSGGSYTLLTTTTADVNTYPNSGLTPLTEYCYKVRAVNGSGSSSLSDPACTTTLVEPSSAISFNGTNQYVTFGNASGLGVTSFTLESWIKRSGSGTTVSTGSGGIVGVPIISKGRCENDNSNVDANYFLGIDASNHLAADFEDKNNGLNHPITGVGTIPTDNTWHHVAVTYDQPSGVWMLYIDGNLDNTLTITGADLVRTPRNDSIQHAAIGTALELNRFAD